MKRFLTLLAVVVLIMAFYSSAHAQAFFDTTKFTLSAKIKPSDFAEWPDSVAAWRVYANYDLDKDGKKEFLVIVDPATTQAADTSMPRILRFEANGNDKYSLVWSAQIPYQNALKGSWPCIEVADLDKDGNQEIIFGLPLDARASGDVNPNRLFIYEYDPAIGNFPSTPTLTSNLGFRDAYYYAITSIVADDVDKDGDIELVLSARRAYGGGSGTASTRPLMIYHLVGDISPGFSSFEREFIDSIGTFNGGYYLNNKVVDFDGNGKKEIWGFTWDMLSFSIYEATGKDTYVLKTDINQASAPYDFGEQNAVNFYDANHDGKLELFMAGQNGTDAPPEPQSVVIYIPNTTNLASLSTTSHKFISSTYNYLFFQGSDIGDIDGDGNVDFFVGGWSTSNRMVDRLRHLTGKPYDDSTGYKLDTLYSAPGDSTYAFPNVTYCNDLDGDGKREIMIVNTHTRANHPEDPSIIILESKVVVGEVKQISSIVPSNFSLEQNFPNPFNPSSKIRFSVKSEGDVELTVANALGQNVATLVNGKFAAGTHEVTFNGDGLATGTYFYTLKAGNFVETKKMMFVK